MVTIVMFIIYGKAWKHSFPFGMMGRVLQLGNFKTKSTFVSEFVSFIIYNILGPFRYVRKTFVC